MVVSLSPLLTVMPIVAFLFVFVIVYALLTKTKLLGDNNAVALMLSLIIAIFFIVNTQLVEFIKINVSWFAVFFICLFLVLTILSFTHADALKEIAQNKGVAWVILGLFIIIFLISASHVFNWALNWDMLSRWSEQSWFGMVLLLIVAGLVSAVLTKKAAGK